MIGITAFGGYVPRRRLARSAIAAANQWFNPLLGAMARGERSLANWDEDTITMAVEASRHCIPAAARPSCAAIYLASTTFPFLDRQNAGVVAAALQLPRAVAAMDVAGSQRAATSALISALAACRSYAGAECALVVAADRRRTLAASPQEMQYGDGAAAVTVGSEEVIAELVSVHSETVDFVDHFRSSDAEYDYQWEERWVRDEGYANIVVPAAKACLTAANVTGAGITHLILANTAAAVPRAIAKKLDIAESAVRDNLAATCGDTGVPHPLLLLVHTLEQAAAGDLILLLGFGGGCDALLFRATDRITAHRPAASLSQALKARTPETNYTKLLVFNDQIPLDKGMRAENSDKTPLTSLYRNRKMMFGLVGGKCTRCGTAQFPRSSICVDASCGAEGTQEDFSFAELTPTVMSWSADSLTFTLDPPAYYGMLTFEAGGRLMADFTDCTAAQIEAGTRMRMVFRIKSVDSVSSFKHYFWKATPLVA
jgi:3-hydroxy-3-methylglutaryl CoA synthase